MTYNEHMVCVIIQAGITKHFLNGPTLSISDTYCKYSLGKYQTAYKLHRMTGEIEQKNSLVLRKAQNVYLYVQILL